MSDVIITNLVFNYIKHLTFDLCHLTSFPPFSYLAQNFISLETLTLYQLNEHIRRILALNLPAPVWVKAEIGQIQSRKGHFFIRLIQKSDQGENIIAQTEAVIWKSDYLKIKYENGNVLEDLLQQGMEILILAKVDYNERYGLKLTIKEIDPAYTLGKLELERRAILQRLEKEKLLEKNTLIPLPAVLQRIAILSSEKAAGYQDFEHQLQNNPYGYYFKPTLFPISVQGQLVEIEFLKQIKRIKKAKKDFDCMVIIRGGGSTMDLLAFDNYEISKAIANAPLPVLSGIGHTRDNTAADSVAHSTFKTPTAVADFIINRNLIFESKIMDLGQQLQFHANSKIRKAENDWLFVRKQLTSKSATFFQKQRESLDRIKTELKKTTVFSLKTAKKEIEKTEKILQLLHPENALKRGFTLSLKDGKVIRSVDAVKKGDEMTTVFLDGQLKSKIE